MRRPHSERPGSARPTTWAATLALTVTVGATLTSIHAPTHVLAQAGPSPSARAPLDAAGIERMLARAEQMTPLSSLLVARGGELVVEEYYRGMRADRTVNVKSVSKTLLSPLVGIAIRDGLLEGVDQPIHELLPEYFGDATGRGSAEGAGGSAEGAGSAAEGAGGSAGGRGLDPRKRDITVGHLLSMRTGLQTTSFRNYGAWISSPDWVWDQLRRPLECTPGRCYEYSTGNSHLLSVILSKQSGKSLRAYAREAMYGALGIPIYEWDRDPQGHYLGGNNMAMRPRDLLKFGQLFLDGGRYEGRQLVPEAWIEASWRQRSRSPWNDHGYGYLWWIERWGGEDAYFAWGYGGQYVVVVPALDLVAVATSSLNRRQRGHTRRLRDFFDDYVVPAFKTGS